MIFHSDLLHTEIFFTGNGKPCTCLYSLVICNNYTLPAAYITDTGNRTSCRASPLFFVHFVTCKGADLNKWSVLIRKVFYSLPGSKLVFFFLLFSGFLSATFIYFLQMLSHIAQHHFHGIFITVKFKVHLANVIQQR